MPSLFRDSNGFMPSARPGGYAQRAASNATAWALGGRRVGLAIVGAIRVRAVHLQVDVVTNRLDMAVAPAHEPSPRSGHCQKCSPDNNKLAAMSRSWAGGSKALRKLSLLNPVHHVSLSPPSLPVS